MMGDSRSAAGRLIPIAIAILACWVIWPAFAAGWLGDDAFYANLNGELSADGRTLGEAIGHAFTLWLWGNGRIFPIAIVEKYTVFHLLTSLTAYKIFLIALTLASIEMFRRALAAYWNVRFANICALVSVTLLQQRGYHDSTLAYNGMLQIVAIAFFFSVWRFARAIESRSRADTALSILIYAIACLTYEAAYPLCLLYVLAARARVATWQQSVVRAIPFLFVGGGLILASVAARALRNLAPDSPYRFVPDAGAAVRTLCFQIVAAFPLSYWTFDPSGIFGRSSLSDFLANAPLSAPLSVALLCTAWFAVRDLRRAPLGPRGATAAGVALTVLPAIALASIAKYQSELRLGLGYLPVFVQLFGTALVLGAAALWLVLRWPSRCSTVALCLAIAAIGTVTAGANVRLGRELAPAAIARAALERQLDGGLLRGLPDGTALAFTQRFDWVAPDDAGPDDIATRGLFFAHGRKRVRVVTVDDPRATAVLTYTPATRHWSDSLR